MPASTIQQISSTTIYQQMAQLLHNEQKAIQIKTRFIFFKAKKNAFSFLEPEELTKTLS